ncbi:MAG: hypothetical protein WB249_01365 [Candidatus Sulfotelmatobacter sp.]
MTIQRARIWLVSYSLAICGLTLVFFLIAPITSYPLEWAQSLRILEIITPVFFGYLGLATRHIFAGDPAPSDSSKGSVGMLGLLVIGPLVIFAVVTVALIVAFGFSNSGRVNSSRAMSIDTFAAGIAAVLSLLTVTTNVIVIHVFGGQLHGPGSNAKLG